MSTFSNNLQHYVRFFGRSDVHSFFSFCADKELKYELEQSRGIKSTNESNSPICPSPIRSERTLMARQRFIN